MATRAARFLYRKVDLAVEPLRLRQNRSRKLRDAGDYWSGQDGAAWASNSHWRDGLAAEDWKDVGTEHFAIFQRFARALGLSPDPGVVVEWGCGGGANAVVFAPASTKFVAADVSAASVAECLRQVRAVCRTPAEGITIDIAHPERSVAGLAGSCNLFLCVYVLELTASPEDALRIVEIANRVLVSGGLAVFQVKYHTCDARTQGRKRNYRRNLANMTTFGIEEFWLRAAERGLAPELVELVPRNALDERYAYYALTKP